MSDKLNGSVERLAEALRDVITEAVDEAVDRKLEPVNARLDKLECRFDKLDGTVKQHGILLRAMAHHMLPEEVLAELGEEKTP